MYSEATTIEFNSLTPADFDATGQLKKKKKKTGQVSREAQRAAALRKLTLQMNVADDTEHRLGVTERWTPDHPEYQKALAFIKNRRFINVVETLEGLVVQRLFELSKSNLCGTGKSRSSSRVCLQYLSYVGYKLRKHISQAITRRSAAVRTALEKYNQLAPLQDPPRPTLSYSEIASYGWLNDFDLLKYSRHDILKRPWANPAYREFSNKFFKIIRAREELVRLNVEIARLRAWVDHEDRTMLEASLGIASSNPLVSAALRSLHAERSRVNDVHRVRLSAITQLEGYSGPSLCNMTVGGVSAEVLSDVVDRAPILVEDDDSLRDDMVRLEQCMDNIIL